MSIDFTLNNLVFQPNYNPVDHLKYRVTAPKKDVIPVVLVSSETATKVRKIAEQFIHNLNIAEEPPFVRNSSDSSPLISEEAQARLKAILTPELICKLRWEEVKETGFYKIAKGHHFTVYAHDDYPDVVFKIMAQETAEEQKQNLAKTGEVVEGKPYWVQVPKAMSIDLEGGKALYIEERLPIKGDYDEHKVFWAYVLQHYESQDVSSTFKRNLKNLIQDIQTLIERVGFWDVGFQNLPEVRTDGKGVCITDFENIKPNQSIAEGLERLTAVFPLSDLSGPIQERYWQEIPYQRQRNIELFEPLYQRRGAVYTPLSEEEYRQKYNTLRIEKEKELRALQLQL